MKKTILLNISLLTFVFTFFIGVLGKSQTLNPEKLPIYSIQYSEKKIIASNERMIDYEEDLIVDHKRGTLYYDGKTSYFIEKVTIGTAFLVGRNRLTTTFHIIHRALEALKSGIHLELTLMKLSKNKLAHEKIPFKIKRIIDLSLINDLALLEIETKSTLTDYLPLRKTALTLNEDLFVISYPNDIRNGKLIELKKVGPLHQHPNHRQQSFFIEETEIYGLETLWGTDGSPVLDKNREVVGIITGGAENLLSFTPINHLNTHESHPHLLNTKNVLDRVFKFTENQAKQGHPEAQYEMAQYLYNSIEFSKLRWWPRITNESFDQLIEVIEGGGMTQDPRIIKSSYRPKTPLEKSIHWLFQAALKGHYLAMELLLNSHYITKKSLNKIKSNPGEQLTNVLGVWILNSDFYSLYDWKFKIHQLQRLADLGSGQAMVALMETYWKGLSPIEQNLDQAIEWALKAAEQNYISILDPLVENIRGENSTAFIILKTIAEKTRKKWFRLKLSEMYFLKGETSEGIRLLQELAEENDSQAQFKLANSYLYGNGVTKDPSKAIILFNSSAQSGHLRSKFELAKIYQDGIHIKKNLNKATDLLKQIIFNQMPLTANGEILATVLQDVDPLIFLAHLKLGDIELEKKSPEKAKKYFTLVQNHGPSDRIRMKALRRLIQTYKNLLKFSTEEREQLQKELNHMRLKTESPSNLQRSEESGNKIQIVDLSQKLEERKLKELENKTQILNLNIKNLETDIFNLENKLKSNLSDHCSHMFDLY